MTLSDRDSAAVPLLVCHSHLRWDWVYQRPQHVLTRFARDWRVIVEEEPVFDDRAPGLDLLQVAPNVTVIRPHRRPDADYDIAVLVEDYIHAVRGGRPLVRWFYSAMFASYGDRLGPDQVVVYDCMDELSNFAGAPRGLVEAEDRLLARADVVFTGGRSLYEAKRGRNPSVHCFPSAVDFDHFARAELQPDLAIPGDLACLPGPILGYYGVIDERLDYDLIAALADDHASTGGSIVLVGPTIKVDPATLPRRSNLHYLGKRDYADLPAYLKGFDVCLMPWALNDATRTISPTKTLEYMAAGRPIVSTRVRDVVRDHGDLVMLADDVRDFVQLARVAPARFAADPDLAARERHRARDRGWDGTARAMRGLVEARLAANRLDPELLDVPIAPSMAVSAGPRPSTNGTHRPVARA